MTDEIKSIEPRIWHRPDLLDHELIIVAKHESGSEAHVAGLVLERVQRHGILYEHRRPTFGDMNISVTQFLQHLVDECWRNGIRPAPQVADSEAKTAHLKDMQRLVFDVLAPTIGKPSGD